MKDVYNQQLEAAEEYILALHRLKRSSPERICRDTESFSGGVIGAGERVRWEMGSADWEGVMATLRERVVGCMIGFCGAVLICVVGARVGINLGAQGAAWTVWTWGDLVGATEGVGTVS